MAFKIGFVGFGRMAEALYQGFLKQGYVRTDEVCFSDPNREVEVSQSLDLSAQPIKTLIERSSYIFFCVKPQVINSLLSELPSGMDLSGKVMISILAGTPISTYAQKFGDKTAVVRVMPNTPAMIGEGVSGLYFENISPAQEQEVSRLFETVGSVIRLDSESQVDVITGLSGSGPAFFYKIVMEMAKEGVAQGLSEAQALKALAQTLVGAGKMLLQNEGSPQALINQVTSPGGTTFAGLEVFEKTTLNQDLQSVVQSAIIKAQELGSN